MDLKSSLLTEGLLVRIQPGEPNSTWFVRRIPIDRAYPDRAISCISINGQMVEYLRMNGIVPPAEESQIELSPIGFNRMRPPHAQGFFSTVPIDSLPPLWAVLVGPEKGQLPLSKGRRA
jgi:hypothetical protein